MSLITKKSKKAESGDTVDLDRFRKRKIKWWLWTVFALVIGLVLWYTVPLFLAVNNATVTNTNTGTSALKQANKEKGKVNILLIGVGGSAHPGGNLADTIMLASIDTKTKTVSLFSVPRDLYVTIPGNGKEKINAVHAYGEQTAKNKGEEKGGGPRLLKKTVSDILGVPIHYFVRVDFEGFKKVIDTLGGVTVNVKTAINDPLYPDAQMKGYDPFRISAGVQKLDGKTALKYVRSRETTSDFDRARRQQEVISAVKEKALTAQVLANPKKMAELTTILGQHILTDLSASETDQFLALIKDFGNPKIRSYVMDSSEGGLLISSRSSIGASILVPRLGAENYTDIQNFANAYFNAPAIEAEAPTILIQNAGVTATQVVKVAKQLEVAGFKVTKSTESLPVTAKTLLYQTSVTEKPDSLAYLKSWLSITPSTQPTSSPTVMTDYVLVLGTDFKKVVKAPEVKQEDGSTLLKTTEESEDEDVSNLVPGGLAQQSPVGVQ